MVQQVVMASLQDHFKKIFLFFILTCVTILLLAWSGTGLCNLKDAIVKLFSMHAEAVHM